ncbi:MAG: zinc ribbon domain-containing protein [Candidatus Aminicenantes bacterium]|nr:zinc ribbon domain-containing protein [Candidatus Aminicenantes bacterium]
MPIYEYKCSKCGRIFEALQSLKAEPIRKCVHCQGRSRKIVSLSSFQLKGSGWYVSDYKKGAPAGKKPDAAAKSEKKIDANAN